MKKFLAAVMAGALALSLTACGNTEMKVNNYSIEDEAAYYHELTGKEVECTAAISMHPSLYDSAVTVPTFENVVNDEWYADAEAEDVTISIYKMFVKNEEYKADSYLKITLSGKDTNLKNGLDTRTVKKYVGRYLKSSPMKKVTKYIEDINSGNTGNLSEKYDIGDLSGTFKKENGEWTLELDCYYDSDIIDDSGFIDPEKAEKVEPYLSDDKAQEIIGEQNFLTCKRTVDLFEIRDRMELLGYETVNPIYQSNRAITAKASDEGETVTYSSGLVFKPSDGSNGNIVIKQSYTIDEKNKTVTYTIENPSDDLPDDKFSEIVSKLTDLASQDVAKILAEKGTELQVSDTTKAVADNDRNVTVTFQF